MGKNKLLVAALYYAELGFSVIPVHNIVSGQCSCGSPKCQAPGKHPRFKWMEQQKKAYSVDELTEIWRKYPRANVGIVTGPVSGILALDIDGDEGLESLKSVGLPFDDLPASPTVKTGGGGLHIYYRYPESGDAQTKAGVLSKVDIRGKGGFVVAPPSMHISGEHYEWVQGRNISDIDPTDADLSLLFENKKIDATPKSGTLWFERLIIGVDEGKRNEAATRLAGRYLQKGLSQVEVKFMLNAWNHVNIPPLSEKEIDQTIKSVMRIDDESLGHNDIEEWLDDTLGMKVLSIKRITGDDPRVILEFDEGTANISTAQLLSPKHFQQEIAAATKMVIRKLTSKSVPTHDQLAQAVLQISIDVDAGVDATEIGEMQTFLKDFLVNQRILITIEDDEDVPIGGVFKANGMSWFSLTDLVQRSSAKWGVKPTMKVMAQRLKQVGAQTKTFKTVEDTNRIVWGVKE